MPRLKTMPMRSDFARCSDPSRPPVNNGPRRPWRGWMAPLTEKSRAYLGALMALKGEELTSSTSYSIRARSEPTPRPLIAGPV